MWLRNIVIIITNKENDSLFICGVNYLQLTQKVVVTAGYIIDLRIKSKLAGLFLGVYVGT